VQAATGVLITVAPTGAESAAPGIPHTLQDLARTARDCQEAGAAVIHLHARTDEGTATLDPYRLAQVVATVRAHSDLVVQLSTGGDVTDGEQARLAVLDAGPDSASLTMGTVNFGDEVFLNRWPFVRALHARMRELGVVAEYECFDLGHVAALHRLLAADGPPHGGRVHVGLVCGVAGGMPGTPQALLAAVAALPPSCTWSATGVGRASVPVLLTALAAGGHLRVGMEDTTTYAPGQGVINNAQLVTRAADLARLAQRAALTPEQARGMLGTDAPPKGQHL
jgi:3-keto-5-aminohexanoate cleavage enzyme